MIKNSQKVLIDSGGVHKEAYILKNPCITMRGETEWTETLENIWDVLVNYDFELLIEKVNENIILGKYSDFYGDYMASKNIILIVRRK